MNKFSVLCILMFFNSIQGMELIKGLRTYSSRGEIFPPIIVYNDFDSTGTENTINDYIIIEFDVISKLKPNLQIVFKFCDKFWKEQDNLFLQNFNKDKFYNLQYSVAPNGILTYSYSFRQKFPDERKQITFPFSGKYKFLITEFNNENIVYGEGYFFVIYQEFPVRVIYSQEVIDDKIYDIMDFNRREKLQIDVTIPEKYEPFRLNEVEIIQNQKFFYSYFINFSRTTRYEFGKQISPNIRRFVKRDLFPGNEYRQINLLNVEKYPNYKLLHSFEGIDISRKYNNGGYDLNGGNITYSKSDIFSEYLDYEFQLTLFEDYSKDVFIVGSFNNWKVLPEYKMIKNGNYYSKIVNLKRGIYDYQYVLGKIKGNEVLIEDEDWVEIEGNFWETENTYYIFVYYQSPDFGGYDKIVAFIEIKTKN